MSTTARFSTATTHVCETVYAIGNRRVVHVVLPPRLPAATPLADLRDAGHDVLAVGVWPEELLECSSADAYPGCEHVILRSSGGE